MRRRAFRYLGMTIAALVAIYGAVVAALFIAMHQPPDRFGSVMKHVPGPMFAVIPFRSMWMTARAGHLRVGDVAPDFTLRTADRKGSVQLSSYRGKQPVVLVFGSYT